MHNHAYSTLVATLCRDFIVPLEPAPLIALSESFARLMTIVSKTGHLWR